MNNTRITRDDLKNLAQALGALDKPHMAFTGLLNYYPIGMSSKIRADVEYDDALDSHVITSIVQDR